ncbi:unnamed protein product [Chironomus riparius]|uniref:Uncharacterized protein n=1 Tax=Chironomus riparius TaxID=315576 RepID=A0A9N9WP68_9DIPT|nr:unnamed protein product [Chironomus riparius]
MDQFRYDSKNKQRSRNGGLFSSIIVYGILAMTIVFGGLFYVFVYGRANETNSNSTFNKTRTSNITLKYVESNDTDTNKGLEVIEISGKNYSESHVKRIKRLDSEDVSANMSPETQRLTFFPTRSLKPPRIVQKPKVIQYPPLPPNHKISSRRLDPRVYQFGTMQPIPHEFLRPPTPGTFYGSQVHNIQDIINQNPQYQQHNYYPLVGAQQVLTTAKEMMGTKPIQLAGSYRHPRTNQNLAQIFQQSKPQTLKAEASDPFQNYKPISPYEVNQMLNQHANDEHVKYMSTTSETPYFRRKFKKKIASSNNYNVHANDAANIYGNGLQTVKKRVQDRNEIQHQGKPFSVMLDVYPMPGEDNEYGQPYIHVPNLKRLKPLMNRYYQDPQMFNSMNFPQVMARYPAYFRYQNNAKQQQLQKQQQQSSTSFGTIQSNGMSKPSQLVVHLNLYPKNNSPTFKRSSSEDFNGGQETQNKFQRQSKLHLSTIKNQTIDVSSTPFNINFNVNTGNGHPENIAHQKQLEFNRTSTEATLASNNYFYDDEEEEDINADQSVNAHPSIVYKDIYRDKPIHLMLKSTTASTKKPKSNKNSNNNNNDDHNFNNNNNNSNNNVIKGKKTKSIKFHYQTLNRPTTKYANVIRPKSSFGPFY